MGKLIFVSNRLPVTVEKTAAGFSFQDSIGGLATGLNSVHKEGESLWVGWCGIAADQLGDDEQKLIQSVLQEEHKSLGVFLTALEVEEFYYGFCNKTIWPLFHYFTEYTVYIHEMWDSYVNINQKYFAVLEKIVEEHDTIWIHDYQLMLLPHLIKRRFPQTKVGFFLHIPFPSYEIFRLMPWREEILVGILGADLVGFHTFDYVRHFTSSVRRILRLEYDMGYIYVANRAVRVDVFPMGIDYQKYAAAFKKQSAERTAIIAKTHGQRVILSVDRLDYTKGIPERIKAFNFFIKNNSEYREKVTMILILAPSRTRVDTYADLRREIEELISRTNGEHGTLGWVPVWFFYRSFGFDELTALYCVSDVLLVTPLRDGMNLVAKEYIATRADKKGCVVISETAGAASELSESLIINPNNIIQIAEGIKTALEMPLAEQQERNTTLHDRLRKYNVNFWANDFISKLEKTRERQQEIMAFKLTAKVRQEIITAYREAKSSLFLLDYDGTLVPFTDRPEKAVPDEALLDLLKKLRAVRQHQTVLISGRDWPILEKWFGPSGLPMVAAHGMWRKEEGRDWQVTEILSQEWKDVIRPVLDIHTARTPGSFIEEKAYSLSWHYRKCDPDLALIRLSELKEALIDLTSNSNIGILDGNKVLEVKDTIVNKGSSASFWLKKQSWDFILAIGDDWTDEDMFKAMPERAYTVKIGFGMSAARFRVESVQQARDLLGELSRQER